LRTFFFFFENYYAAAVIIVDLGKQKKEEEAFSMYITVKLLFFHARRNTALKMMESNFISS
jgi:hypothetical protein